MEKDNSKIKNLSYDDNFFSFIFSVSATTLCNIVLTVAVGSMAINTVEETLTSTVVEDVAISVQNNIREDNLLVINSVEENLNDGLYSVEEKEYSGMALSNEFEDEIKVIAQQYNIPYQVVLAIGERESAGNWDNNGVISRTNDYGEFQINECNLDYIEENLGYTKEEILYNSSKNAEACIFLLDVIINRDDVTTLEDIFGMYNGWINWEQKSQSVEYVNACCEIIDTYFDDYQYINIKKY